MAYSNLFALFTVFLQYIIFIDCAAEKCLVFRKNDEKIENNFYSVTDYFTNPTSSRDFCTSRNAKCMSLFGCAQCLCKDGKDLFLSYQHGCVRYSRSKRLLKATSCMTIQSMRNDQLLASPTNRFLSHQFKKHRLFLPYSISNAKACNVSAISYYEMNYGIEKRFIDNETLPTFVLEKYPSAFYYFKCAKNRCNLKHLSGKLIRLSITCSTYSGRDSETCFVFKMSGQYVSEQDNKIPTPTEEPKKGTLSIKRLEMQDKENTYIPKDLFSNPDGLQPFCSEFKASCYSNYINCSLCVCKDDRDAFISYSDGCMNMRTAKEKLDLGRCLQVRGYNEDILYIDPNYFQYGTCINLHLPLNLYYSGGWSCVVENTKHIDSLTGQEATFSEKSFRTKLIQNEICLQCTSFMCNLNRYHGMLMKLEIKCENLKISQPPIDSCFIFRMGGLQSLYETTNGLKTITSPKIGSIEAERKIISEQKEDMIGNHYKSRDCFTNPHKNQKFCWDLKAVCDPTSVKCSKCMCLTDYSTFISYKHGCMNITKDTKQYGIQTCMHYFHEVILVKPDYFQRKRCVYLQKPTKLQNKGISCAVKEMSFIEPINGKEKFLSSTIPFKISTSRLEENQNNFCLQCDLYNCNLSPLYGLLLKLHIECETPYGGTVKTCFTFKVGGISAMNQTIPLHIPSAAASKKNNSGKTVAAVICVLLVVAVLAVLFFFWWRRKLRRGKSDCAHQVFDKTRTELPKVEMKPPQQQAYASVGACPSKPQTSLQKNIATQKENLYYKATQNNQDPIYTTTDVDLNNPLYNGPPTPTEDVYTMADDPPPYNNDSRITPVEENIYAAALDRRDNPIYEHDEEPKSPDYSAVDNSLSQDNKYYASGTSAPAPNRLSARSTFIPTPKYLAGDEVDDGYTPVMKTNNKPNGVVTPIQENVYLQPVDGFQAQQQQQQDDGEPVYDDSNKYYQVGDVISSH